MQNVRTFASPKSESSAVGSALRSGRRGRAFESPLSDASEISRKACLAFIVYKSVLGISICFVGVATRVGMSMKVSMTEAT